MKIKRIIYQNRRDFKAIYQCDHEDCDHEKQASGYDDTHFHQTVIPDMVCGKCGRKALQSTRRLAPKYPDGFQV